MNKSEKFWDKRANKYDKKPDEKFYESVVKNTKKHLKINDLVLDYACGTGTISNEIAANVKELHAIDISSKMIEVAKRKADDHKIRNVNFAQSTLFDGRYEKESFNIILAINLLHLIEDEKKIVQRINELLKPGGLFISATPCMGENKTFSSIFLIAIFRLLTKTGIVPYIKISKKYELEDLIATHGNFKIVETVNLHHGIPNYFIVAKKI